VQKREAQKTGGLIDELVAGNGIKAYEFWGVRGYKGWQGGKHVQPDLTSNNSDS